MKNKKYPDFPTTYKRVPANSAVRSYHFICADHSFPLRPRRFVSNPSVLSSPIHLQQHLRSPSPSMHAFDLPYQPFALTTEVRGDRPDSCSDSEGSHHALLHYVDRPQKSDVEIEGVADFQPVGDTLTIITPFGADAALTSQTLKADGTPKRPMNAFMIFARLRRSQLSAANHSMRTGECSKILSKEWNSMGMVSLPRRCRIIICLHLVLGGEAVLF